MERHGSQLVRDRVRANWLLGDPRPPQWPLAETLFGAGAGVRVQAADGQLHRRPGRAVREDGQARRGWAARTDLPQDLELVQAVFRRHGKPRHRNAFVDEIVVLLLGGLATD